MSALECADQASPRTCTVKPPHIAALTTKAFFRKCQTSLAASRRLVINRQALAACAPRAFRRRGSSAIAAQARQTERSAWHDRHDNAGMRLAYCRGGIGVREDGGSGAGLRGAAGGCGGGGAGVIFSRISTSAASSLL